MAIGADGGGSIRIPSGLCGVVGLKPTAGRVSLYGTCLMSSSARMVLVFSTVNTQFASCVGDIACFGSTVDVVGPIGTNLTVILPHSVYAAAWLNSYYARSFCCKDVATVMAVIAGPDPSDPFTVHAPPRQTLNRFLSERQSRLQGVRIGVYAEW